MQEHNIETPTPNKGGNSSKRVAARIVLGVLIVLPWVAWAYEDMQRLQPVLKSEATQ